eukprot:1396000-Rhodomonas_salina.1
MGVVTFSCCDGLSAIDFLPKRIKFSGSFCASYTAPSLLLISSFSSTSFSKFLRRRKAGRWKRGGGEEWLSQRGREGQLSA